MELGTFLPSHRNKRRSCGVVAVAAAVNRPFDEVFELFRRKFNKGPRWTGGTRHHERTAILDHYKVKYKSIKKHGMTLKTWCLNYAIKSQQYIVTTTSHCQYVTDACMIFDQHGQVHIEKDVGKNKRLRNIIILENRPFSSASNEGIQNKSTKQETTMSFDKASIASIAKQLEAAMQAKAKELGVTVKFNGGKYDANVADMKIKITKIQADGKVFDQFAEDFKTLAHLYGLQPTDLGRGFRSLSGNNYVITGLSRKGRKRPIVAKSERDGKIYVFNEREVAELLKRQA